jgi:hypothetical protein
MATETTFNGKLVSIPGSYSQTKSGVNNPPLNFSYGNVLVIDKDPNNAFGGGAGISGELTSGEKAVYPFDNLQDFRKFIVGGKLYDNAYPMFRPAGAGSNGVSKIYYVRAFATTGATLGLTWTGGGANGGVLSFKAKHEGLAGNGVQGNEVKAKQTLNITTAGALGDTIQITANAIALGLYTAITGDTTLTVASAYAALVNANTYAGLAHGYTATVSGTQVTIYAPSNLGATANGYTFAVAVSGTMAGTVGAATMAGGVNGSKLTRGLAITMSAGTIDTAKFILKFWRGSFTGTDTENTPYNAINEADADPVLLTQSPEFNNVQEIIDWTKVNVDFANHFQLTSGVINGTGVVNSADLAATVGNKLFTGGLQTYTTAEIDKIMDTAVPLDYTFVYTLDSGANAQSVDNTKILASLLNKAKYEKFLVIGGGNDKNTFTTQSVASAEYYNSDRVIVCHGGCKVTFQGSASGLKDKDSSYKAANVLGRMCGIEPQTPITFKNLGYQSEIHGLSDSEKEVALKKGVLVTAYDYEIGTFVIVAGINTLQRNSNVLNTDGTSHLISLKRISAQLNKELEINAKQQLLGNQTQGPNRATLSAPVIKTWASEFLKRKTATTTSDNLILSFQDVTATFVQDSLYLNYSFVPNGELSKIFITGLIIDPSL